MHSHNYFVIDKSGWGEGPWKHEPDNFEWVDETTGLFCLARRNPHFGIWLGYVSVSKGTPLYGVEYENTIFYDLTPHGGLTFAGRLEEQPDDRLWFFGFDCGHFPDYCPAMAARERQVGWENIEGVESYRTLEYIKTECEKLAKQLWQIQADRLAERIKPAQPQQEGPRA